MTFSLNKVENLTRSNLKKEKEKTAAEKSADELKTLRKENIASMVKIFLFMCNST